MTGFAHPEFISKFIFRTAEIELVNFKTEMNFPDLWRRAVDFIQERNGMNDLDVGPICSC